MLFLYIGTHVYQLTKNKITLSLFLAYFMRIFGSKLLNE